jgi:hypothetical protein
MAMVSCDGMAGQGASVSECKYQKMPKTSGVFFVVDTLEFSIVEEESGQEILGSALNIKPILTCRW